jgi:uncharacterized lipoprotein YmbA
MNKLLPSLLLAALLLSGCFTPPGSSAPTTYYRLSAPAPTITAPEAPSHSQLLLIKVQLADRLSDLRLIVATGTYEIKQLETHRWAEPLDTALASFIASQLSPYFAGAEAVPALPGYQPTHRLDLQIDEAGPDASGHIILSSRWVILNSQGERLSTGSLRLSAEGWRKGDYSSLAAILSRLATQLSDSLRTELSSLDESQIKS